MADIIIQNAAELVVDVSGWAITAFPATGNFMTIEPLADRATFTAQLRSGGIVSINNSDARRLTLLVHPNQTVCNTDPNDQGHMFVRRQMLRTFQPLL